MLRFTRTWVTSLDEIFKSEYDNILHNLRYFCMHNWNGIFPVWWKIVIYFIAISWNKIIYIHIICFISALSLPLPYFEPDCVKKIKGVTNVECPIYSILAMFSFFIYLYFLGEAVKRWNLISRKNIKHLSSAINLDNF